MLTLREKIGEALQYVRKKADFTPFVGMILGSGLGDMADEVTATCRIPYSEIPHFPLSTVPGHEGTLIMGTLEGKNVVVLKGKSSFLRRIHHGADPRSHPSMKARGIQILIVTNAAGGINPGFVPVTSWSSLIILTSWGLQPPGWVPTIRIGPRFPDLSSIYNKELVSLVKRMGEENGSPYSGTGFLWPSMARTTRRLRN